MVLIKDWDKNDAVPVKTAAGLTKTMAPRTDETITTEVLTPVSSDIKDFYRNVMATIDGEAEQIVRHDQMMRVMKVIEAGFRSAAENAVIPFEV